jgi:hypothetical protein
MNEAVFDTEGNGLAYDCDKLHILSYTYDGKEYHSTDSYDKMVEFFSRDDTLFIAHNAIPHDMVVINRILSLRLTYKVFVDTIALSWFLWPKRKKHGLGSFTEESGMVKPDVEDWDDVTYDQMKYRCESDVMLNWWVWQKQKSKLNELYS